MIERFKQYFLLAIVFALPWQARWFTEVDPTIFNEYTVPSLYVLDVAMLLAVLWMMPWREIKIKKVWWILVGVIWLAQNVLVAIHPFFVIWKILTIMLFALFIWILKRQVSVQTIMSVMILSGVVSAIIALGQFFTQQVFASTWLGMSAQSASRLGAAVIETIDERWLRAYGMFPHPNILGGFLSIIILLAIHKYVSIYKQFTIVDWSNRTMVLHKGVEVASMLVAFMVLVAGLVVSFSRTAWMSVVFGIIVYGATQCRDKFSVVAFAKLVVAGALVVGMFVALYPQLFVTRLTGNTRLETVSIVERVAGYDKAFELWRDNWIGGVGMGNYSFALSSLQPGLPAYHYQPVHNVFVLIVIEVGLVGIVLLLAYLWQQRQCVKINELTLPLLVIIGVLAMFDHYLWSLHAGIVLLAVIIILIFGELNSRIEKS